MSATDYLIDINTRHQVQLERYANGEVVAITQALRSAIADLEQKIRNAPGSTVGMELYLRELRTLANELLSPVKQSIIDRIEPLAAVETDFAVAALSSVTVGAEFARPSLPAIQRAALSNVLNGKRTRDFLEEVFGLAADQIIYTMRNGIINGLSPTQMLKELAGTKAQNYKDTALRNVYRNTEAVVRTMFNAVGNEAKMATYAANSDVVTGYRIVATLDSKTSTTCFTGQMPVQSLGGIKNVFRAEYEGEILVITTASGKKIEGTPNHPILTPRGFLPLNELKEGDQVVDTALLNIFGVEGGQNVGMPPKFAELFNSVYENSGFDILRKRPSARDFYGDGTRFNSQIDIVCIESQLGSDFKTSVGKQVKDQTLRVIKDAVFLPSLGRLFKILDGNGASEMSTEILRKPLSLKGGVNSRLASAHGFGYLNRLHALCKQVQDSFSVLFNMRIGFPTLQRGHNPVALKNRRDRSCCGSVFSTNRRSRRTGSVQSDHIVSAVREFRRCHVYSLESYTGLYNINGFIVKNCIALDGREFEIGKGPLPPFHPRCRTTTIPIVDKKFRIPGVEGERASRGADGPEPVGSKLTYPTWLRRQPAAFQDDVLGPTRGRAFRKGDLDLRDMVNMNTLSPLTLSELGLKSVQ